jgi:transposase
MATIEIIREAFFRKGKSISEIAREQKVDRKTVRKFINQDDWNEPVRRRAPVSSKLEPFKSIIDEWLEEDKRRRRKQRHTATRIWQRLRAEYAAEGFEASYRTVAAYVGRRRGEIYRESSAALPLVHRAGEAQADFGEADFIENGTRYRGAYLVVTHPASNAGYLQLFKGQNLECLLAGLLAIFSHTGGVPQRIWFDNASTMVTKILRGGGRQLTERFRRFVEHLGFEPAFCNPAAGHEKGSVENKVGYLRRNLLVPVPEMTSLEDYNRELLTRCDADHQRTHYRSEKTIAELFTADQAALLPLPQIPFDSARHETVRADAYGMVSLERGLHRYSSSPRWARELVRVRIDAHRVTILDESLREIVSHSRLYGPQKQQRVQWLPYLTQLSRRPRALKYSGAWEMMPEPLQQWLSQQEPASVGGALKLLAELTERSSFDAACAAVSAALSHGAADGDSLVALHDRLTRYSGIMPHVEPTASIDAPAVRFEPARYDEMLAGGRS